MDDIQVLVTTMNMKEPDIILNKMNIRTSFVIGNQADYNDNQCYKWADYEGKIITRNERGVGNNRNITLKFSSSEYCVLADDDMTFYDDYPEHVKNAFAKNPEADVIIFNLDDKNSKRRKNQRNKKIGLFNYMNYGAARIAFRRKSVSYNAITFNQNFGGGTKHSAGEDSLFLRDCILHGLVIVAIPETIAALNDDRESTWFNGYNRKYLFDKGVFLGIAHPKLSYLFALYLSATHKEYYQETHSALGTYKAILEGIVFTKRRFTNN